MGQAEVQEHGDSMQARRHRQIMAEFGSKALQHTALEDLLTEACLCLIKGLGVEHAKVLEYRPGDDDLLIVSGIGWAKNVVGKVSLSSAMHSPPGKAFRTGEAVFIEDLTRTEEFEYSDLLRDHGIISLVNVPICTAEFTFGVLEADGNRARKYSEDEKNFLLGFANLIAAAVQRSKADAERDLLVRDLREAQQLAETALESNKRLVAATGHDLTQPVQVIVLALGQLEKHVTDAQSRQLLERAMSAADRLRRNLDQLVTVAQMERKAFEPRIEAVELGPFLADMVEEFRPAAKAKGLVLRHVRSEIRVRTDAHLLEHIVQNLISNAIKYTDQGGVLVGCRRHGAMISVQVHDTGIGIAPGDLERIFDEFQRVDPELAKGRGLGLAIAKHMADLLGQRVNVTSRRGRGTCFSISIPRA